MVLFRHRSIRRDLVVIIMTVSMLSILITSMTISLIHYNNLQDVLLRDLELAADVAEERSKVLMGYDELGPVKRRMFASLSVFLNNSAISLACIYDKSGMLTAFYDASDQNITNQALSIELSNTEFSKVANQLLHQYEQTCPIDPSTSQPGGNSIALSRPIHAAKGQLASVADANGDVVGTLYLVADLDNIANHMNDQILTTIAVCIGALIISYLLAIKLQRRISTPLLLLSQATRNVTVYKDYSVRVDNEEGQYSSEISQLIGSFNAMMKDIGDRDSKLQRKNLELERAKEMAESANMSKSQFLANISHELRTPLNAIIGFSSIIVNQLFGPIGNDKYISYGQDINDSGVHLLDVINDILDLSKAEAGKLSLRLESFEVKDAMKKCEHIMSERAMEAGVKLHTNLPANMPPIIADRVRFIQIMLNLISNSVKFTEEGGRVEIEGEFEPAGNEVHYFTFRVRDTGIGMRKEDIDMAFQTFGQVDSGLDRKYEGTGLGLPLTKKLVELHNGSIRIDSELHKGTTVTVRLISDKALL